MKNGEIELEKGKEKLINDKRQYSLKKEGISKVFKEEQNI